MMKYQQTNSTFVPKNKSDSNSSTNTNNEVDYLEEKNELSLQIERYKNKIKELEKQLGTKETEINYCNNLVASFKDEIEGLKHTQNHFDTTELNSLNTQLNNIKDENDKLKQKIKAQNEQLQLLYVLMIIVAII